VPEVNLRHFDRRRKEIEVFVFFSFHFAILARLLNTTKTPQHHHQLAP
jgi:uncharacterized membrane protein